jgi:drug/metabolite transporter (DMT)-like permease
MSFIKKIYPWLLFIFLGTFAWGTSFFWIKIGLREVSAFEVVAWRFTFGALALWVVAGLKKLSVRLTRKVFVASCILALIMMIVPITLITWSESYISSSVAGLLNSLTPLMTIILAFFISGSKQEVSKQKLLGIGIGFLGILLIFIRDLTPGTFTHAILPQSAVVMAALLYASGTLYSRFKLTSFNPLILSLYSLTWSALILWCMVITTKTSITLPSQGSTWLALIWLGGICSGLATIIYLTLIRLLGSTITSSVAYLFPLTAYFLGVVMLGEEFALHELTGGLAILFGIYIANSKNWFFRRHATKPSQVGKAALKQPL